MNKLYWIPAFHITKLKVGDQLIFRVHPLVPFSLDLPDKPAERCDRVCKPHHHHIRSHLVLLLCNMVFFK